MPLALVRAHPRWLSTPALTDRSRYATGGVHGGHTTGPDHSAALAQVAEQMSDAEEVERLKKDLERCNHLIKTGQAADDLIAFTKQRQDPFHPDFPPAENPWIGGKGSSGGFSCSIL